MFVLAMKMSFRQSVVIEMINKNICINLKKIIYLRITKLGKGMNSLVVKFILNYPWHSLLPYLKNISKHVQVNMSDKDLHRITL